MPEYRYRSVTLQGETIRGLMAASDEETLASSLQNQGQTLIDWELAPKATSLETSSPDIPAPASVRVKRMDLIRFTYNLHSIISAGVPIIRGLESLREEARLAENPMEGVITGLIVRLRGGDSFSEALAQYPKAFPELYVHLVAAGEASGNLEPILLDLAENLEWQEEIKGTLRQATVYPTIVITAVIGLIALILLFVVPQFSEIFKKMSFELPTSTKVLIATGDLAGKYWYLGVAGLVGVILALVFLPRTSWGASAIERFKTRIPLFGPVVMKIALSRFSKNLGVLTNAGIPITESLDISEKVAGNSLLQNAVASVRERVTRGETLAQALASSPVFPVLVRNMVAVGEESGKLSSALLRIGQYYDREVKSGLKRAFAILEPAITVFLAAIVGGIAVTIISTLYKAITLVGKS